MYFLQSVVSVVANGAAVATAPVDGCVALLAVVVASSLPLVVSILCLLSSCCWPNCYHNASRMTTATAMKRLHAQHHLRCGYPPCLGHDQDMGFGICAIFEVKK